MALPFEIETAALPWKRVDSWIVPLTAAIVVGGSILFWCLAGLFWLATHPPQQPIVIQVTAPLSSATNSADVNATAAVPLAEKNSHVRAN